MSSYKRFPLLFAVIFGLLIGFVLYPVVFPVVAVDTVDAPISGDTVTNSYLEEQADAILSVLEQNYYDSEKIDTAVMINDALHAYVDALDDPYTAYLDGTEYVSLVEDLQGEEKFAGIGAVIYQKDDGVMIEQVLKGSPAAVAGLKPFDYIFEVDGESLAGMTVYEAVTMIRGKEGTKVTLSVLREKEDGTADVFERDVVRQEIVNESVWTEVVQTGDVRLLVLEITSVGEETDRILQEKIDILPMDTIDGIVLDLRGNAGGFLLEGVDIASHFLPRGEVVVQTQYPHYKDDVFRSKGYDSFGGIPIVVLIDELTASASEIITLALRDSQNALVVGEESFGKGTIQTLHEFENGSLKYTVGTRGSPGGTFLLTGGIVPDVRIAFDFTGFNDTRIDSQLEGAQRVLLDQIQ